MCGCDNDCSIACACECHDWNRKPAPEPSHICNDGVCLTCGRTVLPASEPRCAITPEGNHIPIGHTTATNRTDCNAAPEPGGRMNEEEFERLCKAVILNQAAPGSPRRDLATECRRARASEDALREALREIASYEGDRDNVDLCPGIAAAALGAGKPLDKTL